jgi:hypothetical protein
MTYVRPESAEKRSVFNILNIKFFAGFPDKFIYFRVMYMTHLRKQMMFYLEV